MRVPHAQPDKELEAAAGAVHPQIATSDNMRLP